MVNAVASYVLFGIYDYQNQERDEQEDLHEAAADFGACESETEFVAAA